MSTTYSSIVTGSSSRTALAQGSLPKKKYTGRVSFVGNILYTVDGFCLFNCEYGRTSLWPSLIEDSIIRVSIFSFDSIENARIFANPLLIFKENRYISKVYFVNETIQGDKFHVLVERISRDLKCSIDQLVNEMVSLKRSDWGVFSRGRFEFLFREIVTLMIYVFLEPDRTFAFPRLLELGAISIAEDFFPKLTRLSQLPDNMPVDHTSAITDLGNTMEYFLTRGAVNVHKDLSPTDKMKCVCVPNKIIDFIDKCKQWRRGVVPFEWLLDSSLFWKNEVIVAWVYSLSELVLNWRSNKPLMLELDVSLQKKLGGRYWDEFIPGTGLIRGALKRYNDIVKINARKLNISSQLPEFYKLGRFYRHVFEHSSNPHIRQENMVRKIAICDDMEKLFSRFGGLCSVLRDVIEDVFCNPQNANVDDAPWRKLMSPRFAKILDR